MELVDREVLCDCQILDDLVGVQVQRESADHVTPQRAA